MYLILIATAVLLLAMALLLPVPLGPRITVFAGAILLLLAAYCFRTLTVRDEGEHLAVLFGPLPVFRKQIAYRDITEVKRARSRVLDGWGIHYGAGRGWTFNLWGFDCVEMRVGSQTVRIGTDDPDGLVRFLQDRTASKP
jgi:hypothetical protein